MVKKEISKQTNIIKACLNLKKLDNFNLKNIYSGKNKMNSMGTALEYFIKDLFCDSLFTKNLKEKSKAHSHFLSYSGNQNNPPDFIIKNSDAVEVKKFGKITGNIPLNSSYPKSKLHNDDSRITSECRKCDGGKWKNKDIIYAVGSVIKEKIKLIWFVYGDYYAADREVYLNVFNPISKGIHEIKDIEFTKTKELARVNRVDPLGITRFRIRGMWEIDSPHQVFDDIIKYDFDSKFTAYFLIPAKKFNLMPEEDIKKLNSSSDDILTVKNVKVKNPNNPVNYLNAKLITITK